MKKVSVSFMIKNVDGLSRRIEWDNNGIIPYIIHCGRFSTESFCDAYCRGRYDSVVMSVSFDFKYNQLKITESYRIFHTGRSKINPIGIKRNQRNG